ncbi:hypothetical protein PGT21_010925 [Puccinia graminis f. sp. tritici]|uniref:Uncharacterized protein n=1 Tax=Puccinia graminis f. sp. tritici TaxID=56615 RepID=A0A5B0QF36_PUCGR|nr:hypothetical protein PGT21_010925 [Puccinia graminis f. sp. tritici]
MVHTRRNTDVPLTIPNFLARVTPPRQTTAGGPSVASTIPFPSDSPLSSLSNSTTAQFCSFSYDMPGFSKSGTPSNPNSPGADDPTQENATSTKEVAKDKGNVNESRQPPPFNQRWAATLNYAICPIAVSVTASFFPRILGALD